MLRALPLLCGVSHFLRQAVLLRLQPPPLRLSAPDFVF